MSLAFAPDRLPDNELAGSALKRAACGALFSDFKLLECPNAAIVWEVTVDHAPPACIKAVKPKYWLLGVQELKDDFLYRIK